MNTPSTWAQFYFELHRSAERLRELMAMLEASVVLLDASDDQFNKPFSQACELDAELQGGGQRYAQSEGAMSRLTQLNFIGQAHLLPGMSASKLQGILNQPNLPQDVDTWNDQQIETVSNRIMEICTIALPEVVAWVAELGGSLEAREGGQLAVKNCRLPEALRRAIKFHKAILYRYVSAFPGQSWPTKGGDEALNVNK